jgi:hypothetical protein
MAGKPMSAKKKPGRNDPCWCGSGKKYKHCHMRQDQAEARESAAAIAPTIPTASEPPPLPAETEAGNVRWEQFEAADSEGKVALFLEILASGEMAAEEAYEMLQGFRRETDLRRDPQARARYSELVERLRQEAPDLYRHDRPYYHQNLINDAIADGRWEAIPELVASFAEPPVERGVDIFFELIDQLKYHGQTESLIQAIKQMWSDVEDSGGLVPWTSDQLGGELLLLVFYQYVETAETPRVDDPALHEVTSPYGTFDTRWLEQAVRPLSALAPSPWQRADFGEAVDADQWADNLNALLFEFMADQRRRAGVPFSKSELVRGQLLELLHQQAAEPGETSGGERTRRTRRRRSKAKKRARRQPAVQPSSPLVPRHAPLDRHLAGLFQFLSAQPHKAAALAELLPAYLHFLARLGLIHPTEMDAALERLRSLAGHLRTALDNHGTDIVAVEAVETAWSELSLAALRDDPALAEARAAPLPEPAPPPPMPIAKPGAVLTYSFKVTYQRKPSVWQVIEISEDESLDDLHYAILSGVDFDTDHLYSFFMSGQAWDRGTEYAAPYAERRSAARVKIGDLRLRMKQKFLYLFDYGDEHRFEVQLVDINPEAPKDRYPRLVESHGKAPRQYGGW